MILISYSLIAIMIALFISVIFALFDKSETD